MRLLLLGKASYALSITSYAQDGAPTPSSFIPKPPTPKECHLRPLLGAGALLRPGTSPFTPRVAFTPMPDIPTPPREDPIPLGGLLCPEGLPYIQGGVKPPLHVPFVF